MHVDESLRRGRGTTGSLGRFGRGLLIGQVALSMTLLVGAGLFTATLAHLRANDTSLGGGAARCGGGRRDDRESRGARPRDVAGEFPLMVAWAFGG